MKLSIANGRPEIGPAVIQRLREADRSALSSLADAMRGGNLTRDELVQAMGLIAEAIVESESFKEKADLRDLYMGLRDELGSVKVQSGEKDARKLYLGLAEVTDNHLEAIQRYDDIIWLGFLSQESAEKLEEMTKGKVISTGAVLARAEKGEEALDDAFMEVARKCLINALYNGGAWTRFHASEALSDHYGIGTPGIAQSALEEALEKGGPKSIVAAQMHLSRLGVDAKDEAIGRLTGMLRSGEEIAEAAKALQKLGLDPKEMVLDRIRAGDRDAVAAYLYIYDRNPEDIRSLGLMAQAMPELRLELSLLSKSREDRHLAIVAGSAMSAARNREEIASAEEDLDFLRNYVLIPEERYPAERLYVEMVFDSVAKVLNGSCPAEKKAALSVLSASGASPGILAESLDSHTLKVIRRNVENALLHAVQSPEYMEIAARGLERIGSDRIEEVLERIAKREGEESAVGSAASETQANIAGKKIEKDIILVGESVKKPSRPPPSPRHILRPSSTLRIN